jgi:hypothetical protein
MWADQPNWESAGSALHGSSHYDCRHPALVYANIGIHHVHHLASRIPYYRLPEVMRDHPELKECEPAHLGESLRCVRLVLWDDRGSAWCRSPRLGPRSRPRAHLIVTRLHPRIAKLSPMGELGCTLKGPACDRSRQNNKQRAGKPLHCGGTQHESKRRESRLPAEVSEERQRGRGGVAPVRSPCRRS